MDFLLFLLSTKQKVSVLFTEKTCIGISAKSSLYKFDFALFVQSQKASVLGLLCNSNEMIKKSKKQIEFILHFLKEIIKRVIQGRMCGPVVHVLIQRLYFKLLMKEVKNIHLQAQA